MKPRQQKATAANRNNPTKPTREQLRTQTPRVTAPRESSRPKERSGQHRAH